MQQMDQRGDRERRAPSFSAENFLTPENSLSTLSIHGWSGVDPLNRKIGDFSCRVFFREANVSAQLQGVVDTADIRDPEDLVIIGQSALGIIDGLSGISVASDPDDPKKAPDRSYPAEKFKGLLDPAAEITGGQLVGEILHRIANSSRRSVSLTDLVLGMNNKVREELETRGLSLNEIGKLPGSTFAFIGITTGSLRFVHGGDCFIAIELRDGLQTITGNQVFEHDKEMRRLIAECRDKATDELHGREGVKQYGALVNHRLWTHFAPLLSQFRQARSNNREDQKGYGNLCGDSRLENFLKEQEVPLKEVKRVVVGTDGLLPANLFVANPNDPDLLKYVFDSINTGGIGELIKLTRSGSLEAHIPGGRAEAAGFLLDFKES